MADLFGVEGKDVDAGYLHLRSGYSAAERRMRDELRAMWAKFEPYADPDFCEGFARDPDARFWEMFLGCALLDAGKTLMPTHERRRNSGRPDICVMENNKRVWVEAIAPAHGEGLDRIPQLTAINEGGRVQQVPLRQAQLRITNALWTKSHVMQNYIDKDIVAADDARIIAIGGGRFGVYFTDHVPLIISSLFPIGPERVTVDFDTGEIIGREFEHSATISRRHNDPIPRTGFVDGSFTHISGIIWSRVSIGNMSRDQRPLMYLHNPLADAPLCRNWGVWDREFVATRNDDNWEISDILAAEDLFHEK